MAEPVEAHPIRRRPGGRSARVRAAVLDAAIEELVEHGLGGASTARIADRAGVHRTTVHRRWPDRAQLMVEALTSRAGEAIEIPDTGDTRTDLRQLIGAIARFIDAPEARMVTRSVLSEAGRSPELGGIAQRAWGTRFALGEELLERGVERGEIRADIAPATLLATFLGPLYLRLLFTEQRLDDGFVDAVVESALDGAAPR